MLCVLRWLAFKIVAVFVAFVLAKPLLSWFRTAIGMPSRAVIITSQLHLASDSLSSALLGKKILFVL